jgi:ABC-type transport system substrate-binding protein
MKQLAQSSFVFLALGLLLVLSIINTCQLNNMEETVLENRRSITKLVEDGVVTRSDGSAPGGSGGDPSTWIDEQAAAALTDSNNLLKAPVRPLVEAKDAVRGGTLRRLFSSDPRGLNPHIANGADVTEYNRYIRNRLFSRDRVDPSHFSPELALKITHEDRPDGGESFTFHLRRGVFWHEATVDWDSGDYQWLRGPHEFTSDDVAFVLDMLQNPQVAGRISALRNYFEAFEGYEVLDEHTIRVDYKEKLYMNLPIWGDIAPAPRWLYMYDQDGQRFDEATWGLKVNEHWYNNKAIGTGPYKFVAWEPGVKIELARNDRYWGSEPMFDRVVFPLVKDQNARPRKIKMGEVDITHLQPEQYRTVVLEADGPVLDNENIGFNRMPTLGYAYIGWNMDTPQFSDKRVRQAMTLAMDREGILENVFHGLGTISNGPFGQQHPCYDSSVKGWPYDLAAAAAKLEEAGWVDTDGDGIREKEINGEMMPFEFSMLMYGNSNEYTTFGNIYREDLLSIGVRMNPRAVEWSTMLKKMDEREFGAYTGIWVLGWEVDLTQLWHSKEADNPKGSNRVGFRNAEADEIIERLRRETDAGERVKLCHRFHNLLDELQPYTFMYQRERPMLYWKHMSDPKYTLEWPPWDIRYWSFNEARPN